MLTRAFLVYFSMALSAPIFSNVSESVALRRIQDHLILNDISSAIEEGHYFLQKYPDSLSLQMSYIKALCENGEERQAYQQIKRLPTQDLSKDSSRKLYEMLAWGVLLRGETSPLLMIRLYSLLGSAFTQDAKAIQVLLQAMKSSNAYLRSLAIKVSASYGDAPLQKQIFKMLKDEKVWYVKIEAIRAAGHLKMTAARDVLREMIANPKTIFEEKIAALIALTGMYDSIEAGELQSLLQSQRAGLRELACDIVAHVDAKDLAPRIIHLLDDPSPQVRISCLNALGLMGVQKIGDDKLITFFRKTMKDPSPQVAITAGWLATIFGEKEGLEVLRYWVSQENVEWKRLSAAAIASSGSHAIDLSRQILEIEKDIFVQANLSIGLIGQRKDVDKSAGKIFSILRDHGQNLWMWSSDYNPLFKSLAPSNLRHLEQIPRYPHIVDRHVKLDLLSILCILRYPQAQEAVKEFLQDHSWGVSGYAASTLIEEGDEQSLEIVKNLLTDPDEKIRVQAALILAMYGGDVGAIETLQNAYNGSDREMKMYILEAIGRIGDQKSIPFLLSVMNEPFQVLRVVAASALIQCIYH